MTEMILKDERSNLLACIDSELNELTRKESVSKITSWVYLTAICGLIWLAIDTFASNSTNIRATLLALLIMAVLHWSWLLPSIYRVLSLLKKEKTRGGIYDSSKESLIPKTIVIISQVVLTALALPQLRTVTITMVAIYIGFSIAASLLFVWAKLPVPKEINPTNMIFRKKAAFITFLVMLAFSTAPAIFLAWDLLSVEISKINSGELKIALLLSVILIMVDRHYWFVASDQNRNELMNLKRDLLLGKIEGSDAAQRFETILEGKRIGQFLSDEVNFIHYHTWRLENQIRNISQAIADLQDLFSDADNLSAEQREIARLLFDSYSHNIEESFKVSKKLARYRLRTSFKFGFCGGVSYEDEQSIAEFNRQIDERVRKINGTRSELIEAMNALFPIANRIGVNFMFPEWSDK